MSALADDDESLLRYGHEESYTNKAWKAVEKDVQHLLELLEERPEHPGDLSQIHHEGNVYRSKSRDPVWKEVRAVLDRDEITFYRMVRFRIFSNFSLQLSTHSIPCITLFYPGRSVIQKYHDFQFHLFLPRSGRTRFLPCLRH